MPVNLYLVTELTDDAGSVVLSTRAPFDPSVLAPPKLVMPELSDEEKADWQARIERQMEKPQVRGTVLALTPPTLPASNILPSPPLPVSHATAIPLVENNPEVLEACHVSRMEYQGQTSRPATNADADLPSRSHRSAGGTVVPLNGMVFGMDDD